MPSQPCTLTLSLLRLTHTNPLTGEEWRGKALLVPEASLSIGYCSLNERCDASLQHVELDEVRQGSCGRGYAVGQHVDAGSLLFEESPFLVVRTGRGGGENGLAQRQYDERWNAFTALATNAAYGTSLATFEDLSCDDDNIPQHVASAAAAIVCANDTGDMSQRDQVSALYEVSRVLMRFESNLFRLDNRAAPPQNGGAPTEPPAELAAAALYEMLSRVNHSCDPSIGILPKWKLCQVSAIPAPLFALPAAYEPS